MREFIHPSRHRLHSADPGFVQGPVVCPNPDCEGGMVTVKTATTRGQFYGGLIEVEVACPVCKGEPVVTNESDIADVLAWAAAARITVEPYEPEAD